MGSSQLKSVIKSISATRPSWWRFFTTLLRLVKPGEHVLASNDVYGGTYRLFERVLVDYGLEFTYVDTSEIDDLLQDLKQALSNL